MNCYKGGTPYDIFISSNKNQYQRLTSVIENKSISKEFVNESRMITRLPVGNKTTDFINGQREKFQ